MPTGWHPAKGRALAPEDRFVGGNVGGWVFIPEKNDYIEVKRAFLDASIIGDTEIVSAQGVGVKIRVVALYVHSGLAVSARFKSAGNNNITALFALGANQDILWPRNDQGWMETNANEALNINLNVGVATAVHVVWVPV